MSEDGSIEKLRQALHARSGGPKARERRTLHEHVSEVPHGWQHTEGDDPLISDDEFAAVQSEVGTIDPETGFPIAEKDLRKRVAEKKKFIKKKRAASKLVQFVFIASFVFFVIAAGIAAFLFFRDTNVVSSDKIAIDILGPVSIPGGDELVLQVGVTNNNPVPIHLADLLVSFPPGTRSAEDASVEKPRARESLGTIEPGERVNTTVSAVLFGKEDTKHGIDIDLEYRIEDSNAIFVSEREYEVRLASAPVTIAMEAQSKISSGQEGEIVLTVASNAENVLENVVARVDYPFGYEFVSATPKPFIGTNMWELGTIAPGEERRITITGVLIGQNEDQRVFNVEVGSKSPTNPEEMDITYQRTDHTIAIERPFVRTVLTFNGKTLDEQAVISPNDDVSVDIEWTNDQSFPLQDVEFYVKLESPVLDQRSVRPVNGFYRSSDDTILYTPETKEELTRVLPGESGNLRFSFSPVELTGSSPIRDPSMTVTLDVKARRLSVSNVPEVLTSSAKNIVRIASELETSARSVYTVGPFVNSGPIPPKADQSTTYTILWTVTNTTNDVDDAQYTARLPLYVEWTGLVDPEESSISYNDVTRQVAWNIGDVRAGSGFTSAPREVAFQVELNASLSQIGDSPILVERQLLTGIDRYTGLVLEQRPKALTTDLVSDPAFRSGDAKVLP